MGGGCRHILEMDSEQAKAAPAGGTQQRGQARSFPIAAGPPTCSCSSRRPWPVGTRGSHATAVPSPAASALFPCFRGATRMCRGQEQGKAPV